MPFFGPRLILTSFLAAIGAILLFIASAAGLAIEPRVLIAIPNFPHASLRLHALRPAIGFDSGLPTSAGADANVSIASITSIVSTNISLPLPTDRTSHTSALSWSVVELAALAPTTNSGSWHRTGAGADASFTIASIIAATDTPAIELSPIPRARSWPVARHHHHLEPNSIPALSAHPDSHTDANDLLAKANYTVLAFASIITAMGTLAIEPSPIPFAKSRPVVHCHQYIAPEPTPSLPAPLGPFSDAGDTNHTLAPIIASAGRQW